MGDVQIILQARTTSARLPAKVLLPINGLPMAILAAKRAANRGLAVIVATSQDSSDDLLAATAHSYDLEVFRGALDDCLGRCAAAIEHLDDDAIVIRLTGDNVFPDGEFLAAMLNRFESSDLDYLSTQSPEDGLPCGLSAEIMRAGMLRQAATHAIEPFDREHVTPWIRRLSDPPIFDDFADDVRLGNLRCTVDILDDYQRIVQVFHGIDDPVGADWRELCDRLAALPDTPARHVTPRRTDGTLYAPFVLGTVQLGMPYGVANTAGMPDVALATRLVRRAIELGVTDIDTARAYGHSEQHLGRALGDGWQTRVRIITKLSPLEHIDARGPESAIADAVYASVFRSCHELGVSKLDTLLLHRADHLRAADGLIVKLLSALRDEGVIDRLGVSVQEPKEARLSLADPNIQHLQLPFNLLDWRWRDTEFQASVRTRGDLVVHARSALLQGLLTLRDSDAWPHTGAEPDRVIDGLTALVHELNREDVIDLCLAYVRAQDWIDGVVLGVENLDQLERNVELFSRPPLTPEACKQVERRLDFAPIELLNPALWQSAHARTQ